LASWTAILIPALVGLVAAVVLVLVAAARGRRIEADARAAADRFESEARLDAEARAQRILLGAEEKSLALEDEWDRRERDLDAREASVEAATRDLELARQEVARERAAAVEVRRAAERHRDAATEAERTAVASRDQAVAALERIAGLTADQARGELIASIEDEARREGSRLARKIEDEVRERAERDALQLVVQATQRVRLADAVETTVSFIRLPSDEMKGRIIGREGRNIRALENATGIDLIVDDTPQAILISSFDPLRRHVARVAIERLVEDGRIHPARIEEVVEKVREEIDRLVEEAGAHAAFELGMSDLNPRLARRIGRMQFHIQHGENLLRHCVEVALVGAHMAAEVGARVEIVRRAGLFHEIGRVDSDVSGHSALASAELAGRFGETEDVVHAIQALHPEVAPKSIEAILLGVANKIVDNRPGARRENLDVFVERLRRVERLASSRDGVQRAYAVKAGKELRVLVDASAIDDAGVERLSRDIARALERELSYPGQVRVTVVRETRAVTFAV